MREDREYRLNLYDYFAFPNYQQRAEARNIFDMDKLSLITVTDSDLWLFDTFFEQYNAWSYHLNNFRSHLGLHLLLMYYQNEQKPLDYINTKDLNSPEGAHKIFFDTFAEDSSLYLISYFDKHLEMFCDLFCFKNGSDQYPSRYKIISMMKNINEINWLGVKYETIAKSQPFKVIKQIRDNFVHNKSSTYYGVNVIRLTNGVYASGNSMGIST